MNEKKTLFLLGFGSMHHLYYLAPFINATEGKAYLNIRLQDEDRDNFLRKAYPDFSLTSIQITDSSLLDYIRQYSHIFVANIYPFGPYLREHLPKSTVIAMIQHGPYQKFANLKNYIASNLVYDANIVSGKKDLDLHREWKEGP